ncbi:MAG: trypsin-like peptidase domain-containing protein [Bacteroidales bacterium]|nr:trypsin-like peptidase domain-containing protein [Bacteroidales bacterium]
MAWEIKISQIHRGEDYELQISVPIDHGSSGGALINRYGEVIGITSAGLGEISSANLNFAVDIERVRGYINK